ncbi:MotE family protein [Desulfogranum mediterraneum]|uniref:MotE family protein n=1 Tax=Desulfogranum mediterraneum TaxID=160661 RepID=UPI000491D668|nr:hypothetical protein [Desulfogranum mediterraneum]
MRPRRLVYLFPLLLFSSLALAEPGPVDDRPAAGNGQEYASVEERRLLVALKEERTSLEQERQDLAAQKKALKSLQEEVDRKLSQLKQQRLQLEELLADKDARELKRIKDLSKMYEKMAAEKAARVFTSLDQGLAVSILEKMKTKAAARVLNNMDRERAAALTTAFSNLETP